MALILMYLKMVPGFGEPIRIKRDSQDILEWRQQEILEIIMQGLIFMVNLMIS